MKLDWFRYLPQLPDDDLWGIAVRGAGGPARAREIPTLRSDTLRITPLVGRTGRVLHGFQIVFISEGNGRFESRPTGLCTVEGGNALLLFPSVWHRYEPEPSTGWIEMWVELDGPTVRRVLGAGLFDKTRPIAKLRDPVAFKGNMVRLLNLVRDAAPGARTEAGALGHMLLAQLQTQHGTGKPTSPTAGMVAAAERLLAAGIDHPPSMPEIARRLGVGYSHLRKEFRFHSGLSPKRYLQRMRLERARRILGSTGDSLDQIAERIGFCSAFHFSTAFKERIWSLPKVLAETIGAASQQLERAG